MLLNGGLVVSSISDAQNSADQESELQAAGVTGDTVYHDGGQRRVLSSQRCH